MIVEQNLCPVVAVTGGMGSGKSTAVNMLERLGAFVIQSDQIGKEILWNDSETHQKVVDEFGKEICGEDGMISKEKLATVVFQSNGMVQRINAIIHPAVRKRVREIVKNKVESGMYTMVVVESALVFEAGIESEFDCIITVAAPEELRIKRAVGQNGVSPERKGAGREDVIRRMNLQMSQDEKIDRADYVLYNEGSESDLRKKTEEVFNSIVNSGKVVSRNQK